MNEVTLLRLAISHYQTGKALHDLVHVYERIEHALGRGNKARVDFDPVGCWEWNGAVTNSGYGQTKLGSKATGVHRLAYETIVGPIPDGYHIDHLCRNPRCVRPEHLEPVTPAENQRRRRLTHCKRGHPRSGDNLQIDSNGMRYCRACKVAWRKEHK